MKKFGIKMAALALCLALAATALSSCGFFVDSYLSDYSGGTAGRTDKPEDITYPEDITTSAFLENTEKAPETTSDERVETTPPPVATEIPETTAPETTEPETTDNIPDEFENHVYLTNVNNGRCKTLVGHVNVTVLIASDSETSWDSATRSALLSSLEEQEKRLESDAAGYGKELDVTFSFIDVKIDGKTVITTFNLWEEEVIKAAGFTSKKNAQKELDAQNDADSNPIVIALNREGRAYARQQTSETSTEMLVLYSSDTTAFRHELYHLYGAEDFYYPKEVKDLAKEKLPESIMNSGEETDALTAFIIGWDDEMDENAYEFLKETSHLTAAYLEEENAKEMFTGMVTDHQLSYGIYTGYLEHGVPTGEGTLTYEDGAVASGTFIGGNLNGYGTYEWPTGDKYVGDWVMGKRTGKGTYTWSSGDSYTGDYVDGVSTGTGTYTWANGNSYTGDVKDGAITGKGVYTFANGTVYEGEFLNGKFHGNGTIVYESGASYTGGWFEGKYHGTGKYLRSDGGYYEGDFVMDLYSGNGTAIYSDGSTYVGEWSDNLFHGYGTYTWATGGSYTGEWYNGKQHGQGKQIYSNGSYYEGEFVNGKRHGTGTMNYVGGDVYSGGWSEGYLHGTGTYKYAAGHEYTGAWENGTITGYGIMLWADGSSYDGYWVNGKRHGYGKYINKSGKVYNGYWENDVFKG